MPFRGAQLAEVISPSHSYLAISLMTELKLGATRSLLMTELKLGATRSL
jgi:hypothetical protein